MIQVIDHIVIGVKSREKTEAFYTLLLGTPESTEGESLVYNLNGTRLFFFEANPWEDHDKDHGGMNHLAFAVAAEKELQECGMRLDEHGYPHSGVVPDQYSGNPHIWLDDPSGLRVELYYRRA